MKSLEKTGHTVIAKPAIRGGAARWWRGTIAGAAVALVAGIGCSSKDLLDVDTDIVTPDQAANPSGALALRAAALRQFAIYTAGSPQVRAWLMDALFTDQLINARQDFNDLDQRKWAEETNPHGVNVWDDYATITYAVPTAIKSMIKYLPDDNTRKSYIGELYAIRGLSTTILAEMYCNGSTFSSFDDAGNPVYDMHVYTNAELFARAVADFDSALAVLSSSDALRSFARIGKARALVDLNKHAEAAAVTRAGGDGSASAAVPTSYIYNTTYSTATGVYNVLPDYIENANFGLPLNASRTGTGPETANGLDYGADPRIRRRGFLRNGQDGSTPIYPPGVPWEATFASPFPVASGVEARLIEAEADLKVGNAAWLTGLNDLRARNIDISGLAVGSPLAPLADPGTAAGRVDLVFQERAMWMYITIHRWGDMRRLIRQYGRTEDKVFPSGTYFKGGTYGNQVVAFPLPSERNHPAYKGCLDLKA